jgi:ribosomal protein L37AE/L43A
VEALGALQVPITDWRSRVQSKVGGPMEHLNCPSCGYAMSKRRDDDIEHCPRCLAQTAGALSIRPEPRTDTRSSRSAARGVVDRLTRRVRSQLSK